MCRAIRATFERRNTAVPGQTPAALTAEFFGDDARRKAWQAFLRRHKLEEQGVTLEQVAAVLRAFLMPPAEALARGGPFEATWPASGPWAATIP